MALTGTKVQDTYLDVVQLEKSGAGLPAHGGKEAAIYDGSGAQILGRTAVRHWLDPDPDAIAGTWEFSTYGDANQAALESAGWTFTGCTASVTRGQMVLVKTAIPGSIGKAELTVNLSGDFDYFLYTAASSINTDGSSSGGRGLSIWVSDTSGSAHGVGNFFGDGSPSGKKAWGYKGSTYASLTSGTEWTGTSVYGGAPPLARISRASGTVYIGAGVPQLSLIGPGDGSFNDRDGWKYSSVADASTFNRLIITFDPGNTIADGFEYGVYSIRRYL